MIMNFANQEFDIILQAGQSNAEGSGYGEVAMPYTVSELVWCLQPVSSGESVVVPAAERVCGNKIAGNFSLSFADQYIENGMLASGRKLLIIRAAVGATGFSNNRWGMQDDLFSRMMDMLETAMSLNRRNRVVAFLWHQGENDANSGVSFETHYTNLSGLLAAVRSCCANPQLPFIAGDFVKDWADRNCDKCEPVIRAMRTVCNTCGSAMFVETDGLLSNAQAGSCSEVIHFSRESLYHLGEIYFTAYRRIIEMLN